MSDDIWAVSDDGRLANLDGVIQLNHSRIAAGAAHGTRGVDVRVWGGVDVRLLPDRGFDLAQAWFRGTPLAWISAVGERGPLSDPQGLAWSGRFGGGLLTTCGLRNVGAPSEGHGLHGTASHLAATDVDVRRFMGDGVAGVVANATMDDVDSLGHHLRLRRMLRTQAGVGRIDLTDAVVNLGRTAEPAPILYHLNFGYPLWSGDARLVIANVAETIPRDDDAHVALDSWDRPPEVADAPERGTPYRVTPTEGWADARIENRSLGLAVTVMWRTAELPRLHQWIHSAPGVYVLGIEPANCSVRGRAFDRDEGRLPVLQPGEARETRLSIAVEELA